MSEKDKRKQIVKISVFITSIFLILFSITYAFLTQTLSGTRKVVITAGALDLVLEEENEITISDALPMYDEVGMIQEDVFVFRLVNNTSVATNYVLKLQEIETGTLDKSIVKYGLIKEGEKTIDFVSNIVDGVIDEGTIAGNDTLDYELRLWIDSKVTSLTEVENKFLSFKMGATASQDTTLADNDLAVDWAKDDGYTSQISFDDFMGVVDSGIYIIKISDTILTKENMLGLRAYYKLNDLVADCGTNCTSENEFTQEFINENIEEFDINGEKTGILIFGGELFVFVEETYNANGVNMTPGVWTFAVLAADGVTLEPLVTELIIKENKIITFAGVTKSLNIESEKIFNSNSAGCYSDLTSNSVKCNGVVTNGVYQAEDDDDFTYFYRGQVDNLVKFGEYKEDYYIYRFTDEYGTSDFVSLEACKFHDETCSDANKVLKYAAGTPMYWRIVRINGDRTIRMVYAGTSTDASGSDLSIGESRYSDYKNELKYTGYTYDRDTIEVDSAAKTELEKWYSANFSNTNYDSKVATGRFCSDSSGYGNITVLGETTTGFAPYKRVFLSFLTDGMDVTPTFKCPVTSEKYGGSYNFKIGLLTIDEVVAAGSIPFINEASNYLASASDYGQVWWTMTPLGPDTIGYYNTLISGWPITGDGGENSYGSLRPVINLKSDVVFKEGTDGSTSTPYELLGY